MKTKYLIFLSPLLAFSLLFAGCDDAKFDARSNSVYLADAAQTTVISKNVTLDDQVGLDLNIIVRLARRVDRDVVVGIGINPDYLDDFNEQNATDYKYYPAMTIPEGTTVTIPAGEISASYVMHIDPFDFDTEGKKYCIPVELGEVVEGDVPRTFSQDRFIYVISEPLVISVPIMYGRYGMVNCYPVDEKWGVVVTQWSLEFWCKMSGFQINNQAIFNMVSDGQEVAYIRFGDANSPYNYIQIKSLGGQIDGERDLVADTWYHWAFVYDGTDLTIYRDGQLHTSFTPPAPDGGTVKIDEMQMISSGSYFRDECGLAEVRLWSTAISQTQIQNNMIYAQDATNPNLIAYWPMSEGSGTIFYDKTGNGHDGYAQDNVILRWEDNVRFDR
ncbi:MAG: DUF1735 and LamG domain-containing protein [Rikenellaceae bacterium]|nr:DUF1735 and LamG domain-containing protein [Rikenellaceae bacterium]